MRRLRVDDVLRTAHIISCVVEVRELVIIDAIILDDNHILRGMINIYNA